MSTIDTKITAAMASNKILKCFPVPLPLTNLTLSPFSTSIFATWDRPDEASSIFDAQVPLFVLILMLCINAGSCDYSLIYCTTLAFICRFKSLACLDFCRIRLMPPSLFSMRSLR